MKKKAPKICLRQYMSRELAELALFYHPGLKKEVWYRRVFTYVLYPMHVDRDTKQAVLGQEEMRRIVGKQRVVLADLTKEYEEATGHVMTYTQPDRLQKKARCIAALNLHPDLQEAYEKDLMKVSPNRVRVDEFGTMWSKKRAKQDADLMEIAMLATIAAQANTLEDQVAVALTYMNTRSFDLAYKAVMAHGDEAADIAKSIDDRELRLHTLRHLACIFDNPKPFYAPSERSTRLAPVGQSLVTLKREVRKAITRDWWTVDFVSAQLAVLAMVLELPLLTAFLRSGKSLWREFMTYLGTDKKDAIKHIAMYPFVFGAALRSVKKEFDAALYPGATAKLIKHPIIQEILVARTKQRKKILQDGGARNCLGSWIAIPPETKYAHGDPNALNVRSVQAQLAQAWEFMLMFPIFKLAIENPDVFQIALYQYDGVSIVFSDSRPERQKAWKRRIMKVAEDVAAEYGIHTRLEEE